MRAQAGDQIVVDGRVVGPGYLEIDESLLTGEADLVVKRAGDAVLSGSFCVAGSGFYEAETVGADSFANKVTATAQSHRRFLTPLQHQANVLVRVLVVIVIAFEVLVAFQTISQHLPFVEKRADVDRDRRPRPQQPDPLDRPGLRAWAPCAWPARERSSRRPTPSSRCRTSTSCAPTRPARSPPTSSACTSCEPLEAPRDELERLLAAYAASTAVPNRTIEALAAGLPGRPLPVADEAPFSSERKWSGLAFADGALPYATLRAGRARGAVRPAAVRRRAGRAAGRMDRRRLARPAARRHAPAARFVPATGDAEQRRPALPPDLVPLGLVSFADELRPKVQETLREFAAAGIAVKVISGDDPRTVAALATQAGSGRRAHRLLGRPARRPERARVRRRGGRRRGLRPHLARSRRRP